MDRRSGVARNRLRAQPPPIRSDASPPCAWPRHRGITLGVLLPEEAARRGRCHCRLVATATGAGRSGSRRGSLSGSGGGPAREAAEEQALLPDPVAVERPAG